jgi:uncharacterized protein YkwD
MMNLIIQMKTKLKRLYKMKIKCKFLTLWMIFLFFFPFNSCDDNPVSNNENNHLNDLGKEVHRLINLHRISIGLEALEWNELIAGECRTHSTDMANARTINHDGFDERINKIRETITLSWAGENVALNWSVQSAVTSWLNGPGHKSNIESNSNLTGVGVAVDADSALYLTQIFVKSDN